MQTLAEYRSQVPHVQDRPRPARDARLARRSPRSGTTTRSRTTTPATSPARRRRQVRVPFLDPPAQRLPRLLRVHAVRALHRQAGARPRPLPPDAARLATSSCSCSTSASTATTSPAATPSSPPAPRPSPSRARFLGDAPARLAEAPAARLGRHLEADRQPADDHGARHRRRSRRSTRTRGTATARERARPARAHPRLAASRTCRFLTGDIHTFFAGDVGVDGRGPESVATEFVGGSITSLGVPETLQSATGAPLTKEQFLLISNNLPARQPAPEVPGAVEPRLRRGRGVTRAS